MVHKNTNITCYDDEFPLLEGNGLYASQTQGEGNCLFAALSDQIYGHEENHHELRQRVVEHLSEHSDYFKVFIDVAPVRRAPKRKAAAGGNKGAANITIHSESEIDQAFEERLQRMRKNGVFGDNLEIQAFAREFNVDVKIYQREYAYVIRGGMDGDNGGGGDERQVVHIAYHLYEHYSSIRNRDGPHSGPPSVTPRPATPNTASAQQEKLSATSVVKPWMEAAVSSSLPYTETPEKVHELLTKHKGDVNMVVSMLIDEWEETQTPSSTSLERDESVAPITPGTDLESNTTEEDTIIVRYSPPSPPSSPPKLDVPDDDVSSNNSVDSGSRYKRRKSPAGTPVRTTPTKPRKEGLSPGDDEWENSDEEYTESRRRKKAPADREYKERRKAATPTVSGVRRSPRIQAKAKGPKKETKEETPAESDGDSSTAVVKEKPQRNSGPKSRKQKREDKKAKRKAPAAKKKDLVLEKGTAQITSGIRELYV